MRLLNFVKIYYGITKEKLMILYKENRILVNDKLEKLTYKLNDNDIVKINGKIITKFPFSYYLYNKPKGILSMISDKKESYINQINVKNKLMVAGRLDKDSHGLIILTNDLKACNEFLNKDNHVEKEYIVKTKEEIDLEFIEKISKPQFILNKYSKECIVKYIDNHTFNIILKEGMNRQIRRMAKNLGKTVIDLERIRFGNYKLSEPVGKYKYITKDSI